MDARAHWERVYQTKSPAETSWYEPHLQTSLEWMEHAAGERSASIIDIGGGESTLVDDLLATGYRDLTVLDIAEAALEKSRKRLGEAAKTVRWIVGDVTTVALPVRAYDVWHDRALFHFLTEPERRAAYVRQITASLKRGGQVVMATFGPKGPQKCSGFDTRRYDADSLLREMGPAFRLVRSATVEHRTPFGTTQQFLYCQFGFELER